MENTLNLTEQPIEISIYNPNDFSVKQFDLFDYKEKDLLLFCLIKDKSIGELKKHIQLSPINIKRIIIHSENLEQLNKEIKLKFFKKNVDFLFETFYYLNEREYANQQNKNLYCFNKEFVLSEFTKLIISEILPKTQLSMVFYADCFDAEKAKRKGFQEITDKIRNK